MELAGTWIGYYEYGAGYVLPQFGERVKTTFHISGTPDDFEGFSEEDQSNELAVPHKGTLKGFCADGQISFVLTYPVKSSFEDSNSTELSEKKGKQETFYDGYVDEENNAIYGSWAIIDSFKNDQGVMQEFTVEGPWLLRKVEV